MENMGNHAVFYKKIQLSCPKAKIFNLTASWYSVFIHRFIYLYFQVTVYSFAPGLFCADTVKSRLLQCPGTQWVSLTHSKVWGRAAFLVSFPVYKEEETLHFKISRQSTKTFFSFFLKQTGEKMTHQQKTLLLLFLFSSITFKCPGVSSPFVVLCRAEQMLCWLTLCFV